MQGAFLMFKKGGGKMIRANSTVTINQAAISRLTSLAQTALEQTVEALHTEVVQAQVMPRDTGALQNESTYVDKSQSSNGKVSIVHSSPYARRLYYHPEYNFSREENIAAGGKWFEPWQKGGRQEEFCPKAFKEFYKRLLRGAQR